MTKIKILTGTIILLIILLGIIYGINQSSNKDDLTAKKENTIENKLKSQKFYRDKNSERYLAYQEKNPNLSLEDIIINTNIGLDQDPYTNIKQASNLNDITILVNKYNVLPKDYVPENLEYLDEKYSKSGMRLVKEAKVAFEEMAYDALKENYTIIAMSTYRSYEYQTSLYNNYVKKDGSKLADTYSARPGHSEHQTGLAVDIYNDKATYTDFDKTKEYTWMQDNAYKYGFILRYPSDKVSETTYQYEPWHYRYVGKEIAKYIYTHNITYDRYYMEKLEK